jgi:methyl-accepting chemotaxis protein
MRSIRTQFVTFAAVLVSIVAGGGLINYSYTIDAAKAGQYLDLVDKATESHMAGTFFNEEGRAIMTSVLGLYAFPADEKKPLFEKLRINNADPKTAINGYAKRAQDAVTANIERGLGSEFRENFEKHLAAFRAYHSEINKALDNPPETREQFVEAISRLNALRSKIGEFRKINSEALSKATASALVERDKAISMQKNVLLATFGGIVLMLGAFLTLLQRQFGNFGTVVAQALADLQANRPLSVELKGVKTLEFAVVAESLDAMKRQAQEMDAIRIRETTSSETQKERLVLIEAAVSDFRQSVEETMSAIDGSLQEMTSSAHELSGTVETASERVLSFSRNSENADIAATVVASASTEMAQSISSLSTRLRQTFEVVVETSRLARDTDQSVEQMDRAAHRIGEVISLIRSIAEQTNLLALNATIEAARAGEAGRGFSVVAAEVKDLAARTAQATEEITSQIAEIQKTTGTSVTSIRAISQSVRTAEDHTQEMSSVLDQQDSTIRSVAESAEASLGHTKAMREGTFEIEEQIATTRKTADVVTGATEKVRKASRDIDAAIARFLDRVAA